MPNIPKNRIVQQAANGGTLTIQTTHVTVGQQQAVPYLEMAPGEYVLLEITDTGTGMEDDVRAHIFEPFFTTKPKDKGTGLGLAMCFGIVKQSGGHISVYSELGHGTTFKIYVPRVELQCGGAATSEILSVAPKGNETLLLVEDEPAVRKPAASFLHDLGYTVLEANNGVEALQIVQKQGGQEIRLLFTDVIMPEMGGKELADRLRTVCPKTKILFASGYTEAAIVHQGVLDTGIEFLQKPYTLNALARKVREALAN